MCVPYVQAQSSHFIRLSSASDEEVTITRMLDKVLRRSDVVDKESLCVLAGQRVRMFHCLGWSSLLEQN